MIEFGMELKKMNKSTLLIIYILVAIIFFSVGKAASVVKNHSFVADDSVYDLIRSAGDQDRYDEWTKTNWKDFSHIYLKPFLVFGDEYGVLFSELLLLIVSTLALFAIIKDEYLLMLLFLISPFFINNYLVISDFSLVLTMLIIAIAIYSHGKEYHYLSLPFLCLVSYVYPLAGLVFVLFVLYGCIVGSGSRYFLILSSAIWVALSVTGKNLEFNGLQLDIVGNLIFEFGAIRGLPILIIVIGLIGLYKYYKDYLLISAALVVGIILMFFDKNLSSFLIGASLIFFTWKIIDLLISRKWELDSIKTISIYMVFCGIIFSYVSGINMIATHKFDNPNIIEGLEWIRDNSMDGDEILISSRYISKMEYIVERASFPYFVMEEGSDDIILNEDYSEIIRSRNIDETAEILNRYGIDYIIITPDLKIDFRLKSDSDGILFIVENYNQFIEVYHNDYMRIFRYHADSDSWH